METIEQLETVMSSPTQALIEDLEQLEGDIMILGVGGKMGPTLAKLAKRAVEKGKASKTVYGVSRFSSAGLREELEANGIKTISADFLNESDLANLPDVKNVIYMAGTKFGTTGNEAFTWAMNTYLPGRVADRFKNSRMVIFSTGNVYPFSEVMKTYADEQTPVNPLGEYAQSCLGRERIATYFSLQNQTPILIIRLNYAIDLRYGVLHEIAKQVKSGLPIDLTMGHVNVIWQGDANSYALRSLRHCQSPPQILNVTGPETVSIRWIAEVFGEEFGTSPVFINEEKPTALLANASQSHKLFGYPNVTLREMISWTAKWIDSEGESLDKPTHFQERKGAF
ncbi:NAD-dependent epimerase/dehydratase family protein [Pseudalkalibacillus sp. A8]|uniref:NAD-dependent epimerase/dehydratase family protein n=1 Tax=Pseudalkalibacillus sp. A8 TaxID=3382641 RepID=UPI0038B43322